MKAGAILMERSVRRCAPGKCGFRSGRKTRDTPCLTRALQATVGRASFGRRAERWGRHLLALLPLGLQGMRGRPCFRLDDSLARRPRTPGPCVVRRLTHSTIGTMLLTPAAKFRAAVVVMLTLIGGGGHQVAAQNLSVPVTAGAFTLVDSSR